MAKRPNYTPGFMKFWMAYPKVLESNEWKRRGKCEAAVVWEYMCAEDKAHAMYAVQFEKPKPMRLWAKKWLAERLYDDVDMPEIGERLPPELTNSMKGVPESRINTNNERNRQMKELAKDGRKKV